MQNQETRSANSPLKGLKPQRGRSQARGSRYERSAAQRALILDGSPSGGYDGQIHLQRGALLYCVVTNGLSADESPGPRVTAYCLLMVSAGKFQVRAPRRPRTLSLIQGLFPTFIERCYFEGLGFPHKDFSGGTWELEWNCFVSIACTKAFDQRFPTACSRRQVVIQDEESGFSRTVWRNVEASPRSFCAASEQGVICGSVFSMPRCPRRSALLTSLQFL